MDPSLEFVITTRDITATGAPATLLIFNNEKGFHGKNIEALCNVGNSTKKGNRKRGYIGEKGTLPFLHQFLFLLLRACLICFKIFYFLSTAVLDLKLSSRLRLWKILFVCTIVRDGALAFSKNIR